MTRKPPPPPPGHERRRHERYELLAQLELIRGGEVSVLAVRDISAGGLYVELGRLEQAAVQVGDDLHVFIDAGTNDAGEPLQLETNVEVVRVALAGVDRPAGFGVRWASVDPAAADALARILAHLRG